MASIRRGTIVRDIIDSLKLQVGNVLPDQTSDKLVLTYDFSNVRKTNLVKNIVRSTSAAAPVNVFTTDPSKQTFLTGAVLTLVKDAACDVATGSVDLRCTVGGLATSLIITPYLTLTATRSEISVTFKDPIPLDKNTAVSIGSFAFAAGLAVRTAQIYGFEVDG